MKIKQLEDLKMKLIDLQNELIKVAIQDNNIDDDHLSDYSEYDDRIKTISDMIDIIDDLMELKF